MCNVSRDTGWKELTGPRAESTHSSRGAREIRTGDHTHAGQNRFARVDPIHTGEVFIFALFFLAF